MRISAIVGRPDPPGVAVQDDDLSTVRTTDSVDSDATRSLDTPVLVNRELFANSSPESAMSLDTTPGLSGYGGDSGVDVVSVEVTHRNLHAHPMNLRPLPRIFMGETRRPGMGVTSFSPVRRQLFGGDNEGSPYSVETNEVPQ